MFVIIVIIEFSVFKVAPAHVSFMYCVFYVYQNSFIDFFVSSITNLHV